MLVFAILGGFYLITLGYGAYGIFFITAAAAAAAKLYTDRRKDIIKK